MMQESGLLGIGENKHGIGRQIILPWSKAFEISFKSIRARLARSFITTGGIIFAVMFLMSTLTSGSVVNSLKETLPKRIQSAAKDERRSYESLASTMLRRGEEVGFSDVSVSTVAKRQVQEARMREVWMVALALLVAFVGVINAMLMSVTERFREIGTMKCLGALDSFIVKLFLIESSLQGFLGTLLGVVLGLVFALVKLHWDYGALVWEFIPAMAVSSRGVAALACGTLLAVIGALYPAFVAARMEPVVAMRVDQ
jgi:ABC-type lipoprotein release transport system permease subunit